MFVADAFMLKIHFKIVIFVKSFFFFFVVEAYDHFKISNKQNQQSVYCGDFFKHLSYLFTTSLI